MTQLKMIYDTATCSRPRLPEIPEGYVLRAFSLERDADAYLKLRLEGGFVEWPREKLEWLYGKACPDGIRVIEHLASGRLVASACCEKSDYAAHPEIGTLGWVMASEDFRGKGLGKAAVISAMQFLHDNHYPLAALSTDDWRIPAISIYFKLGWLPCMIEEDMPARWQAICDKLGLDFAAMKTYPRETLLAPLAK